jgi:hypothetical protein
MTTTPETAPAALAHIVAAPADAAPADAAQLGPWMRDGGSDSQFRRFTIRTSTIRTATRRTVEVRAEGEQHSDGSAWRMIAVDADTDGLGALTSIDARAMAAALLAAADELDRHACR